MLHYSMLHYAIGTLLRTGRSAPEGQVSVRCLDCASLLGIVPLIMPSSYNAPRQQSIAACRHVHNAKGQCPYSRVLCTVYK